ncbi:MAG: hypothetical protein ACQEXX_26870 [Bacillota bacterium]
MRYNRQRLQAIELAKQFEIEYYSDPNNNKFTIEFLGVTGVPGEWSVGYNVYSENACIIDGPLAMIIDDKGNIVSLEEYIMRLRNS